MADATGDPPNILIVEDERALADLYAEWLTDSYTVSTAYTGEEALAMIDSSIDIVLLDRRLPDISGDEVLDHITQEYGTIQVAIVSAVTPDFPVLGLGIEDYLHKPVDRNDLRSLVTDMLERTAYDEPKQKLARLQASKATLEAELTQAELTQNEEYQDLIEEINRLRPTVN